MRPASMIVTCLISALPLALAQQPPELGVMHNDDGDLSFVSMDPEVSARVLRERVDSLARCGIDTLCYSVGAGSDVLYYPTQVASVWGWRETSYDDDERWGPRIRKIVAGMQAGVDPIRVAGEQARSAGMRFFPSYRMNDSHFMSDPFEYPLTGRFWIEHHETMTLGISPLEGNPHYANLLDFSHPQVRDYRYRVLAEVIERYADIMDGIEVDFNRVQVLFPPGEGPDRAHLITGLLARVRSRLDEVGHRHGRDYLLVVRVPPAPANCRWAGLDVAAWMRRGLVDVLIPAQLMTLSHDMPVDEFVAMAEGTGCQIYPAVYPRTSWTWALEPEPSAENYRSRPQRRVTPQLVFGAASGYWQMGASGIQLYNFRGVINGADLLWGAMQPQLEDVETDWNWLRDIVRGIEHPRATARRDAVHAVTPAYYLDSEDTWQYRKQIPADLAPGQTRHLRIAIGPDPASREGAVLRLGLRDADPATVLRVGVNHHVLHHGPVGDSLMPTSVDPDATWGAHPPCPTGYLHLTVPQRAVRPGWNAIEVSAGPGAQQVALTELQLGLFGEEATR